MGQRLENEGWGKWAERCCCHSCACCSSSGVRICCCLLKRLRLRCRPAVEPAALLAGDDEGCDRREAAGRERMSCTVTTEKDSYRLSVPSPGEYMIYSASMATAIGEQLGLSREEIVAGVAAYQSTGSRMRRIRLSEGRMGIDE